jgi:hypothetical protein
VFDVEFYQSTLDILYISHISQPNSFTGTTRVQQTHCKQTATRCIV